MPWSTYSQSYLTFCCFQALGWDLISSLPRPSTNFMCVTAAANPDSRTNHFTSPRSRLLWLCSKGSCRSCDSRRETFLLDYYSMLSNICIISVCITGHTHLCSLWTWSVRPETMNAQVSSLGRGNGVSCTIVTRFYTASRHLRISKVWSTTSFYPI